VKGVCSASVGQQEGDQLAIPAFLSVL
jgi:hypothetical protein